MGEDDKYTYFGSGGVLVNAFDIRDGAKLDAAMNDYASVAMAALRVESAPDWPSRDYLTEIHTRMFARIVPGIAGASATSTCRPVAREFLTAGPNSFRNTSAHFSTLSMKRII